ncbi:3752_t:CDS:2, partial [Gigaspora margarita]
MESSNSEYSDPEYSDPEHLVYESKDNYEKDFNNEEIELNEVVVRLREAAQGSMSLDNFFKPVKKLEIKIEILDSDISDSDIENNNSISEQLNKLNNKLKDIKNMNTYEYFHLLAMHKYLIVIFNNEEFSSHIDLSCEILQQVFQRSPWMAHHIHEWSKSWITTETLPISKQEQRKYTQTLIDNEDVQNSCLRFICTMEIVRTWLCYLGLVYKLHQQSVYYNRHEHPNLVQYCAIFPEKIKDLEPLMPQFVSNKMEIVINPEI